MRNYQPKKNNSYKLPHVLFYRMVYLVKDYNRMKDEINDILLSCPSSLGTEPYRSHFSDPTGEKVVHLEKLRCECDAIERALKPIPVEYHKGILDKICYDKPYPIIADASTYRRWKGYLLYHIAQNLLYI